MYNITFGVQDPESVPLAQVLSSTRLFTPSPTLSPSCWGPQYGASCISVYLAVLTWPGYLGAQDQKQGIAWVLLCYGCG